MGMGMGGAPPQGEAQQIQQLQSLLLGRLNQAQTADNDHGHAMSGNTGLFSHMHNAPTSSAANMLSTTGLSSFSHLMASQNGFTAAASPSANDLLLRERARERPRERSLPPVNASASMARFGSGSSAPCTNSLPAQQLLLSSFSPITATSTHTVPSPNSSWPVASAYNTGQRTSGEPTNSNISGLSAGTMGNGAATGPPGPVTGAVSPSTSHSGSYGTSHEPGHGPSHGPSALASQLPLLKWSGGTSSMGSRQNKIQKSLYTGAVCYVESVLKRCRSRYFYWPPVPSCAHF